jgi:hypothetical protein
MKLLASNSNVQHVLEFQFLCSRLQGENDNRIFNWQEPCSNEQGFDHWELNFCSCGSCINTAVFRQKSAKSLCIMLRETGEKSSFKYFCYFLVYIIYILGSRIIKSNSSLI